MTSTINPPNQTKNLIIPTKNQRNWKIPVSSQHLRAPRVPERNPEACNLFKQGKCFYEGRCKYQHILQERLIPNEPRTDMLEMGYWCKYSSLEICPFGHNCRYNHKFEDNSKRIFERSADQMNREFRVAMRKTKLCKNWVEFGTCSYGGTCCYAHGKEELKKIGSVTSLGLEPNTFAVDLLTTLPRKRTIGRTGLSYSFWQEKKEKKQKKISFKWDDIEKISRIYADWIDLAPVS